MGIEMRTYVIAFVSFLAFSCLGQDGMRLDPEFGWVEDGKQERVKMELSSPVLYNVSVSEVNPAKPASFEVKDVEPVKDADPVKSKVVASFVAELAVAASSEVPDLLAVALENATEAQVPYIAQVALAKTDSVDVPTVFSAAIAKVNPVDIPAVFAAALAKVSPDDVPAVFAAALAKVNPVDVSAVFEASLAKMEFSKLPSLLAVSIEKSTDAQVPYIAATMYAELVRATVKSCSPVELYKIKTEWYEKFHAKNGSKLWWILRMAKKRAERGEDVSNLKKAFDETMNKWVLED
jgi:hypothetical protein